MGRGEACAGWREEVGWVGATGTGMCLDWPGAGRGTAPEHVVVAVVDACPRHRTPSKPRPVGMLLEWAGKGAHMSRDWGWPEERPWPFSSIRFASHSLRCSLSFALGMAMGLLRVDASTD